MSHNHHNHDYATGLPLAVGDRYYAQDLGRDFWYLLDQAASALALSHGVATGLLSGGVAVKGGDWTHVNVTLAKAFAKYSVTIPDSFASLPPTTTTADITVMIAMAAQTAFSLAGATLNGSTPNYLKLAYAETDGSTRARAKKAGSYAYERVQGYVLTCTAVPATDYECVLATIIGDGASFLTITAAIPLTNASLQDKVCPVGTLRSELAMVQPSTNYPWLCLDTIGTYLDVTTTAWDVAFIDYLRNLMSTYGDGTVSPKSAFAVTNYAISLNVVTLTLSTGAQELAIIAALGEDQIIHGSYTGWRTVTLPVAIGPITAGTYAIKAITPGSRTLTFDFTAGDASGSAGYLCNFYAHRIAGSTTSARLWGAQGVSVMSPNDVNSYHINSLRRRGFMQGHWHSDADYYNATSFGLAGLTMSSNGSFTQDNTGNIRGPSNDGVNGVPLVAKVTEGPSLTAHLYINGRNYKL